MALYPLIRPLVFALDAERAHRAAIDTLNFAHRLPQRRFAPSLRSRVAGIDFPSPVGLAAGLFASDRAAMKSLIESLPPKDATRTLHAISAEQCRLLFRQ